MPCADLTSAPEGKPGVCEPLALPPLVFRIVGCLPQTGGAAIADRQASDNPKHEKSLSHDNSVVE